MAENPESLYRIRFGHNERELKNRIWKTLCSRYFQRWVDPDATVLDLGAGYCEFINNIDCKEKHALDVNEEVRRYAAQDVVVHVRSAMDLPFDDGTLDVVFASNFFEHLRTKQDLVAIMTDVRRALAANGRFLIMQPNIRFAYKSYWDFLDHYLPLSDRSMREALELAGFAIDHLVPRFLPYTTKSRIPKSPVLVATYLRFPPIWRVMGQQLFVVASPA